MKERYIGLENYYPKNNREAFDRLVKIQDSSRGDSPARAKERWDKRADYWEKERRGRAKDDYRMKSAFDLLTKKGLLTEDTSLCDIGCGPGRFAVLFGQVCKEVIGLDISPNMISYGLEHIKEANLTNVDLRVCDFENMDLKGEGYYQHFDVVFGSFTPAIHDINTLVKAMEMSKAYCCLVAHQEASYPLRSRLMEEVFGREMKPMWTGKNFYTIFNQLFLMGYNPETSYDTRVQESLVEPDLKFAEYLMEHLLDDHEQTDENAQKILGWLKDNADENGQVMDLSASSYGTIIWDVSQKVARPEYY